MADPTPDPLQASLDALTAAWNAVISTDPIGARVLFKCFGHDLGAGGGPFMNISATMAGKARQIDDYALDQISRALTDARSEAAAAPTA